ncbi:MAG: phosphohistidine phosphatase SixA [Psychrobacter sp.]|nr:phosphohistidine phosphatase SixA [Psychrobacter sp.]
MKIILMRHGQAEAYQQADNIRQLTPLGHQQAKQTAEYLLSLYQPDFFVVSPYDRAQQTLAALSTQLPEVPVSVHDNITPSDDAREALTGLADVTAECLVVVCHMSIIAKLAALLIGETPESFALAEARVFEMDFVAADMAKEVDRFVPAQS